MGFSGNTDLKLYENKGIGAEKSWVQERNTDMKKEEKRWGLAKVQI